MDKNSRDPVHCWLVWGKAFHAAAKYLYAGLEKTGIDDTDFRILEVLLNKGPLPVNTIGPKVHLTPGSISTAVDRLVERGLVSRVESPADRRVRVVSLTAKGKELIAPIFHKHAAEIRKLFADASPKELRTLEATLKKIGKRAESLGSAINPRSLHFSGREHLRREAAERTEHRLSPVTRDLPYSSRAVGQPRGSGR